jgi:periplasmic divalent cation tolerance protein
MRVVLITAPPERAEALATALVEERLVACVNLVPGVTSIYFWEGKLCRDGETLLVAKTRPERLPALIRRVRELHPYAVPEVIALPVQEGNPDYVAWVEGGTAEGTAG